jgi:hypothetical protein
MVETHDTAIMQRRMAYSQANIVCYYGTGGKKVTTQLFFPCIVGDVSLHRLSKSDSAAASFLNSEFPYNDGTATLISVALQLRCNRVRKSILETAVTHNRLSKIVQVCTYSPGFVSVSAGDGC